MMARSAALVRPSAFQAAAKTLMKDAYREIEGRELYETGKALEDQHHRPKLEAEQARRDEVRERPRARSR